MYIIITSKDFDKLKDGIYCGFYNKENCIYRIKDNKPIFVQFIENNSIFDKSGILISSVEILIKNS